MNLEALHDKQKEVSAKPLFNGKIGATIAIQLQQNGTLKEHITKTPALLICISGAVTYEDENEGTIKLSSGDYVEIEPNVKHWLYASEMSQLVLIK